MREQWARYIAFLSGLIVVLLAVMFAIIQNPTNSVTSEVGTTSTTPVVVPKPDAEEQKPMIDGSRVYATQGCSMCHSIAGKGNPRNPLDGIGGKRSAESIRHWIVGAEAIKDQLPASIFRVKQKFASIEKQELDALVVYLQGL